MPAAGGRRKTAAARGEATVLAPRALVPCAQVADVARSATFYEALGFAIAGRTFGADGVLQWAILEHDGAQLMLALANAPIVADEQAVLFYVYYRDAGAAHGALQSAGIEVGPLEKPSHSPRGEFRIVDPDGYIVQVTHT